MGKNKKKKRKSSLDEFAPDLHALFKLDEDPDEVNIPIVANEIKNRIIKGASVNNISQYRHKALKNTLSYFRVSGRATLTYKEDMAKRLVEVFGQGTDESGKKSKKIKDKKKIDDDIEITRMIIRDIKRRG